VYAPYSAGYYAPPRVVVTEPAVYVQRSSPPPPASYWYWCESEQGYYPDVPSCPEAWVPVPPRSD
jgi:hypothetical protein